MKDQNRLTSFSVLLLATSLVFLLAACSSRPPKLPEETVAPTESAQAETDEQWSSDPAQNLRVSNLGGDQATPHIVTTNGDIYVTWFSNPPGRQNYDVRMQRFDALGNALWEKNGRIISDHKSNSWITDYVFAKDHQDNLILAFQDLRDGNSNLYAYRFSPEGEPLWGKDGLKLTDAKEFVAPYPSVVTAPNYIMLMWAQGDDEDMKLRLQKLTPDGKKLWGEDGLIAPGQDGVSFIRATMVSSGDDGVILVYGVANPNARQVMSLYAQKLDENGQSVWNDGTPILLHDSVPFYLQPELVSDGAGGAFAGWQTTELKSFVQHLDADGKLLMPEGGAPVVAPGATVQIGPKLQFSADQNALYVFWMNADHNQNKRGLSGQKMSPAGELLWAEEGQAFVPLSSANIGLVTPRLSDDDIIVFYGQGEASSQKETQGMQLLAMLIDQDGAPVWEQPTPLASSWTEKSNLDVASLNDGAWIAVWAERDENGRDIFMQRLLLADPAQQ